MPWVIRDVVRDVNRSVARRWRSLDPLLPLPDDLPEGCSPPLVAPGHDGRPAALAVCRHQRVADDSLNQTWGATHRFLLTPRVKSADTLPALDSILAQWRDHLAEIPASRDPDSAAIVTWPTRDVTGVRALQRHGLVPMAVIAARPPGRAAITANTVQVGANGRGDRFTVREAGPDDVAVVSELEMGVVRFDANFGGAVLRPASSALLRADVTLRLSRNPNWTFLAERDGQPIGLVTVQPPGESGWLRPLTSIGRVAYLQTGFVLPGERGHGTGERLVRHVHALLDRSGVELTLLHYAQVNPLSGPFWSRLGYRPLWTIWESRPASVLR
jgi:GNAT superfamily N-acetyltransferase